jgi:hypothetical protein
MNKLREVKKISQQIADKQAELTVLEDDKARCQKAATAGDRTVQLLDRLRRRKAEIEAEAFVANKTADTVTIDAEILGLEEGTSKVLADSRAALLALDLLEAKHVAGLQLISELDEKRLQTALDWLAERRNAALDAYEKALNDLGPVIAEAAASDAIRARLGDSKQNSGAWLRNALREQTFPIPPSRLDRSAVPAWSAGVTPILWQRDIEHGAAEKDEILVELAQAGLTL